MRHSHNTPPVWDAKAAAHLLSRAGFGGTPEETARFAALPLEKAIDLMLDEAEGAIAPERPAWVKDPWVNTERRYADTTREQAAEGHRTTRRRYATEMNQLRSWWLAHMIATPTPLREVMTLFWHGHFATATDKVMISQAIYQQNETLRRLALGNFRTLLRDVTLDPAMLIYLDLEDSDKAKPNENYAREFFELFTLGIGHYSEQDIKATARALTGWTLAGPRGKEQARATAADTPRDFARDGLVATYVPERRDDGSKTILGETGHFELDDVVALVSRQESLAQFLAAKLVDYFGAVDPRGQLRTRMATTFQDSRGEIREVLRVLFTAPEFYSEASRGSLIKSPVQLLVGACRQLKLDVTATPSLAQLTAAMGQELFNPPNVKGWPGGRTWIGAGTLAVRYHLPEALLDSKEPAGLEPIGFNRFLTVPRDATQGAAMMARMEGAMAQRSSERKKEGLKCRFRTEALFPQGPPAEPTALVDDLLGRLVVTTVRPSARDALIKACADTRVEDRASMVARLILTSPEYQLA
ncbi:DUF1800 domain-containing protein [Singulisphaera acidiphila]|uniref:DUF1800 domain-containing protein n=1 Tax=Singulisphaera acidiphila (strain ATCC BAA-1392 / DSM 18658 / VKM B-2454 / MOB10) TaxID=886293 RepID=L0DDS6_SINAD|nr:DUF1800 domain-containing protein [Singulisphaera acidiphila]AGA27382.1 hypothetical protein Sinac_3101 [Singulisphaera acidiphila DSM 18658]